MILVTSKANPIWHFKRVTSGPRRIVHVPPRLASADWSGTDATVIALAKQQLGAGMEPIIITTMALSEIRHEIVSGIRVHRHPYSYYCFGTGETNAQPAVETESDLLSNPVFQSLMQEPEVRLFHAHALGRLASEVRNAARMRFRPFVATVHPSSFSLHPASGTLTTSRKDLEDADMVIFEDKAEADRAAAFFGHDRVAHLPSGVDCARFTTGDGTAFRTQYGIAPDAFVIGHLHDAGVEKAQWLLESFSETALRHPGIHLVMVAPGHVDDSARLTDLIEKRKLNAQVILLTERELRDPALIDAIHACDVMASFSRSDVLEAWSAGKPVIASHTESLAALVRDHETGMFFEPGSPLAAAELEAYLQRLATDEALRRRLGEEGRKEAVAQHDWSRISTRLEEIYQLAEKHHQVSRLERGKKAA